MLLVDILGRIKVEILQQIMMDGWEKTKMILNKTRCSGESG